MDKKQQSKSAKERVQADARGQFARNRKHGAKNNGVMSADPVVTSGDDDATFENHPDRDDKE